jgi:hypothetical protein
MANILNNINLIRINGSNNSKNKIKTMYLYKISIFIKIINSLIKDNSMLSNIISYIIKIVYINSKITNKGSKFMNKITRKDKNKAKN